MTDIMHETFGTLVRLTSRAGYPPTLRELGDALGIAAPSVLKRLRSLEQAGWIERVEGQPRAIRLIGPPA